MQFRLVTGLGCGVNRVNLAAGERFLPDQPEIERIGQFLQGLVLALIPALGIRYPALALLIGFLAPLLRHLAQLVFLFLLLLGRKRLVVARHQALVERPLQEGHIPGLSLSALDLAGAVQYAQFQVLEIGVVAREFDVLLVDFHGAPHDFARVLRRENGGQTNNQSEDAH